MLLFHCWPVLRKASASDKGTARILRRAGVAPINVVMAARVAMPERI